jgi:hypothetical protein
MAAKKKATGKTRPGRGSDQFIVRMPPGMRNRLAEIADEHGRSMNSEAVYAFARYIEFHRAIAAHEAGATSGAEDRPIVLSEIGLSSISKALEAGVAGLVNLLFDVRDIDLDAFISDQRSQGFYLTRTEAIRKILRAYLDERGFVHDVKAERENPPA